MLTCHFVNLSFCQLFILLTIPFIIQPICQLKSLLTIHSFSHKFQSFHQLVTLTACYFTNIMFCQYCVKWVWNMVHLPTTLYVCKIWGVIRSNDPSTKWLGANKTISSTFAFQTLFFFLKKRRKNHFTLGYTWSMVCMR